MTNQTWTQYPLSGVNSDALLEEHDGFSLYSVVEGGCIGICVLSGDRYLCKVVPIADDTDCPAVYQKIYDEAMEVGAWPRL